MGANYNRSVPPGVDFKRPWCKCCTFSSLIFVGVVTSSSSASESVLPPYLLSSSLFSDSAPPSWFSLTEAGRENSAQERDRQTKEPYLSHWVQSRAILYGIPLHDSNTTSNVVPRVEKKGRTHPFPWEIPLTHPQVLRHPTMCPPSFNFYFDLFRSEDSFVL